MSGLLKSSRMIFLKRFCSTKPATTSDPAKYFFDERVQKELKFLTGLNYEKVFRVRKLGQRIHPPTYQFLTEAEYDEALEKARKKAEQKLQMPPMMAERKPRSEILASDPALLGLHSWKYVFTDITYDVHDRERLIVVREPNGDLRTAEWEERDRINQIYFPKRGRRHRDPPMFEPENLREILVNGGNYEHILSANCVQFEPDHPKYIRTTETVYDHIDETKKYDALTSTRFYGPMVFYFVFNNRADNLLAHYMLKKDVNSAFSLVKLYSLIHPDSITVDESNSQINVIRNYVENVSPNPHKVKFAFEAMLEMLDKEKTSQEGVMHSHGSDGDSSRNS